MKISVNGMGRIGRLIVRALAEDTDNKYSDVELVAVNGTMSIDDACHMLNYDSAHGRLNNRLSNDGVNLILGDSTSKILYLSSRDPSELIWGKLGVDLVLECTGAFNSKQGSMKHIESGASHVLISAPAKDVDLTVVYGVNHNSFRDDMKVISNASCTTNCLAPLVQVLDDAFGIDRGFATTIHAITNDQLTVDSRHKDLRRARAAGVNMIPTSTGAAKAVSLVLPHLANKIDGAAIRVPTINVSLVDFVFNSEKSLDDSKLENALVEAASEDKWRGIFGVSHEPLVSCDFITNSFSSVVDTLESKCVGTKMARVLAWYDNEWGFACRMLDMATHISKQKSKNF